MAPTDWQPTLLAAHHEPPPPPPPPPPTLPPPPPLEDDDELPDWYALIVELTVVSNVPTVVSNDAVLMRWLL